jgi:hypothetical protein
VLDAELCADASKLDGMGDARIAAAAKEIAYRLDAQAVVDCAAKATEDRTVTIRPAPDTMTYVTALLPVAQGVGVYAALNAAALITTAALSSSGGQLACLDRTPRASQSHSGSVRRAWTKPPRQHFAQI